MPTTTVGEQTDGALLEAVRAGDLAAYGRLFQQHAEPARRLAARWVTSSAEQHELVAEAFARVLTALRRGAGPRENLRPYLLVTMRNVVLMWRRRQARVQLYGEVPDTCHPLGGVAVESEELVLRRWNADIARSAFDRLPPRWRQVLWYSEVEHASHVHTASMLGISPNAVAALAMRAREGLRQAYLQVQVPSTRHMACRAARDQMGVWIRGGLSPMRARPITDHLADCPDCRTVSGRLADANRELAPASPSRVSRCRGQG